MDFNERLASIQHDTWCDFKRNLYAICEQNNDGSLTIPKEYVKQWRIDINTPYEKLSLEKKEYCRDKSRVYISVFKAILAKAYTIGE